MGAAPLSWLAKIGGDTLKTKAKLLSSAINELHDDGQCKIVALVDNTADNGKTVLITTDDNKTYSGTIANKKCEFLLPPKTLYTVQKVSSGSAEFTTKVEAGYGDCILVHLDTGYVEVKQGDIVGLDYIKAATDDNLKNKVPEAKAVKELNSSLAYSDSEIICGKWINGKSIYRKVIFTITPSQINIATNLDVVSENLESLVKLSIVVENEDGYKYFGSSFINTADLSISVWINPSNQIRMMVNSDYFKSKPCIVIAEYTKKD